MKMKVYSDFGSMVFSHDEIKKRLPKDILSKYENICASSAALDKETADAIASAMKDWALEKGCTHYTHWFQPLTGTTAEKHETFLDKDGSDKPIIRFNGKTLIKGEPDASSFPSGGLRSTFEARGYTYWDYSSPAFIRDNVLCIPSAFVSYHGESLDKKGPLIKSIRLISEKATKLLQVLGYDDVKSVMPMVGLEQEYFLIDRDKYLQRLDLMLTGRTLFGHAAPKGQEFDDHYFGSIPLKVQSFMKEVNEELWKLGIYAKTEHNEVAPGQFELAPLYANANIAVDQNQLIMDILKRVAEKHELACLLHEKPFDSINGSGKHNNYSLVTDAGMNVFDAGTTPEDHLRFLLFISMFIKAVDTYPELLRISAANPGNDFRLGCNEAPPAIISVFLGDYIEKIIEDMSHPGRSSKDKSEKIEGLSYVPKDNTDRNRTSPVAFTGNKFEFRMLGSSVSASLVNVVLNTIMADSIDDFTRLIEEKPKSSHESIIKKYIKDVFKKHGRIVFSKDGYSAQWVEEAAKRGLPNISSSIEAIEQFDDKKNVELLTSYGIYSKTELAARKKIMEEQYIASISLEVKTMLCMCESHIIPYMVKEIDNYAKISVYSKLAKRRVEQISCLLDSLSDKLDDLRSLYAEISAVDDEKKKAVSLRKSIVPLLLLIRSDIDGYEKISSREIYTIPAYSTMLY